MLLLGLHTKGKSDIPGLPAADTIAEAIRRDSETFGTNVVQIFTHGPRTSQRNKYSVDAVLKATEDMNLSVHSPYSTATIWREETDVSFMKNMLDACSEILAWGLVVHLPKKEPDAVAAIMWKLLPLAEKAGVKIVLEMPSMKSDAMCTYETPEKINRLTKAIGPKSKWWCWCIDTSHLHGTGCSVATMDEMRDWLDALKYPQKIGMFHLNGSSNALGSGKDTHEVIFAKPDLIYHGIEPSESGVRAVIEFAVPRRIPIVLEVNRAEYDDVTAAIMTCMSLAGEYEDK